MLGLTVLTAAAVMAVGFKINPVLAGLSLTYALELTKYLKFGTRMVSKAEADFNSAERVLQYCNVRAAVQCAALSLLACRPTPAHAVP
jgi:ATP-binding cassette, subfamily C (CFTR/MRP), member 1